MGKDQLSGGGGGGEWTEDGNGNIVPIDGEQVCDGTTTADHQSANIENISSPSLFGFIDKAEDFDGSEASITTTDADASGGNVSLIDSDNSQVSENLPNNYDNKASKYGIVAKPTEDTSKLDVHIDSSTANVGTAYLHDYQDNLIDSQNASSGDTITWSHSFTSGNKYKITIDGDSGSNCTRAQNSSPSFTYNSSYGDVVEGVYDGLTTTTGNYYNFDAVTFYRPATMSGSVTVQWSEPADVYSWDDSTFQSSPDGETVEVYVEEDQSGGWKEIQGPISRGDNITADPSNNVRFRMEISRNDTANNPSFDAIYRRYLV